MPDQPADDAKRQPEAAAADAPKDAAPAAAKAAAPATPDAAKPADTAASKAVAPAASKPAAPAAAAAAAEAAKAAAPAAPADAPEPVTDEEREALRQQWADEAREKTLSHDRKVRNFLLRLSLLNWGIAIVAWTISAALGITSPASIIVYSVLFVIGLVAAILAILTYLLEKFGHEPSPIGPISGGQGGADTAGGDGTAAEGEVAAPAAT